MGTSWRSSEVDTAVEAPRGADRCELLLRRGRLLDPMNDVAMTGDVAIAGDRIAVIGRDLSMLTADTTLDCAGSWITPGWIDAHTHIFHGVSTLGAPVREALFRRGVIAACDAGTVGAATLPSFLDHVVDSSPIPVFSFLNISLIGVIDGAVPELAIEGLLDVDRAVAAASSHPNVVRGFKARLSVDVTHGSAIPALRRARCAADEVGLPLMIHIGDTAEPLVELFEFLHSGDIVSHCYTNRSNGIVQAGRVAPHVLRARERGVLFDSAHGKSNFSFSVARTALDSGFVPDIISSDTSLRNWRGPVFDLATTVSKFLALGLSLTEVIPYITGNPARLLAIPSDERPGLVTGRPADLTIFAETDESVLVDSTGEALRSPRLEPTHVVARGELTACEPWRGLSAPNAASS